MSATPQLVTTAELVEIVRALAGIHGCLAELAKVALTVGAEGEFESRMNVTGLAIDRLIDSLEMRAPG